MVNSLASDFDPEQTLRGRKSKGCVTFRPLCDPLSFVTLESTNAYRIEGKKTWKLQSASGVGKLQIRGNSKV